MENCGQQLVEKPDDVFRMMGEGDKLRHVGATNMNEMSSRSHAIATLVSALCGMFVVLLTARRYSSCRIIFRAIYNICIRAKVVQLLQKEDSYYMSRLRDTNDLSS